MVVEQEMDEKWEVTESPILSEVLITVASFPFPRSGEAKRPVIFGSWTRHWHPLVENVRRTVSSHQSHIVGQIIP
jgi:hypothetical protein